MKQNETRPEESALTTKKRAALKKEPDAAVATATAAHDGDKSADATPHSEEGLDARIESALHAASDKKAHDLVALDLRPVAAFTDFFLIGSAQNTRQVQAIADEVVERLKALGSRAARVEGYNSAEWVLIDYGDFIFHVFEEKARRFYDLERLWREAARVPLPPELAGEEADEGGSLRTER